MLFNSYQFIFIFLPLCLFVYYMAVNKKNGMLAKIWLIAMSLWFYGSFQLIYLWILLGSLLFNYVLSWAIVKNLQSRILLIVGMIGNLGLLVYFKYMNFFIENINAVLGSHITLWKVLLPLGISFFTFQQISFLVDTYKGEIKNCGWVDYMLYMTYFPKLVEGPIVTPSELLPQFQRIGEKTFDIERFMKGLCLLIFGMLKKVILADTFGSAVDYGYSELSIMHSLDAVLLIIFYALQLYFDFSGYCDMGRGISWMFGIELPVNFNSPYKASNIIVFWKRWHITLNRFFTKYIYIPLGGNREGKGKMYRNFLIVFLLSGLWHGAGWNFILWGFMHGVLYVVTRMRQEKRGKKEGSIFGVLLTFCFVSVAWVYFRAGSVSQGNELLHLIFKNDFVLINRNLAGKFNLDEFWYILKVFHLDAWKYGHYILMFLITAFSLFLIFFGRNAAEAAEKVKPKAWTAVCMAGLFLWCVLTFSNVSTFLYFNF